MFSCIVSFKISFNEQLSETEWHDLLVCGSRLKSNRFPLITFNRDGAKMLMHFSMTYGGDNHTVCNAQFTAQPNITHNVGISVDNTNINITINGFSLKSCSKPPHSSFNSMDKTCYFAEDISSYNGNITVVNADVTDLTIQYSMVPTSTPTTNPTYTPTLTPSQIPSKLPSQAPSETPSQAPSETPSETPTATSTVITILPTASPSQLPSINPTISTLLPSLIPSDSPTITPTINMVISPQDSNNKGKQQTQTILIIIVSFMTGVAVVLLCIVCIHIRNKSKHKTTTIQIGAHKSDHVGVISQSIELNQDTTDNNQALPHVYSNEIQTEGPDSPTINHNSTTSKNDALMVETLQQNQHDLHGYTKGDLKSSKFITKGNNENTDPM